MAIFFFKEKAGKGGGEANLINQKRKSFRFEAMVALCSKGDLLS
jgi:hypothetical protein